MKSRFFRVIAALGMALTFALSGSVFASADQKAEISYEIEYEVGRTYLTLTPSKDGNTLRYTTDGSSPSKSSKEYSSRISTKRNRVIRAAEYDKKGKKVATVKVELKLRCAEPTLTAEETEGGFLISLSSETKGSTVYYTVDGSKPQKTSAVYDAPFFVKKGTTVRAYASKSGYKNSEAIKTKVKKANKAETGNGADPACAEILEHINGYRTANGASPLAFDETLQKAAELRAAEITELYSHDRPDGTTCFTAFDAVGFSYQMAGENIAWTEGTLSTPAHVSKSWYDSPMHRKNILTGEFEVTGIASATVGNRTYWVQLFAKKF